MRLFMRCRIVAHFAMVTKLRVYEGVADGELADELAELVLRYARA